MVKDKKINWMFMTLWFSSLLKGMEISQKKKKVKRRKKQSLIIAPWAIRSWTPHDLSTKCWAGHQDCLKGHCPVPKMENFITSFARQGKVSLQVWPPAFRLASMEQGEEEKRNVLPLLYHVHLSWPHKKQHFPTAQPVSKNPSHNSLPESLFNRKKLTPHTDKFQFQDKVPFSATEGLELVC